MTLQELRGKYVEQGFSPLLAASKACQDVMLNGMANSRYRNNVTVKGGVVMQSRSGDVRRATRDIDFDFIHYPLSKEASQG